METSGSANSETSTGRSTIDDTLTISTILIVQDSYWSLKSSQDIIVASWCRAMTITLSVKNKLGFIDGSITKPTGTELTINQDGGMDNFFQSLDKTQYHHLMTMFASHLSSQDKNDPKDNPSSSHSACICLCASMNPSLSSTQYWVMDYGAS